MPPDHQGPSGSPDGLSAFLPYLVQPAPLRLHPIDKERSLSIPWPPGGPPQKQPVFERGRLCERAISNKGRKSLNGTF